MRAARLARRFFRIPALRRTPIGGGILDVEIGVGRGRPDADELDRHRSRRSCHLRHGAGSGSYPDRRGHSPPQRAGGCRPPSGRGRPQSASRDSSLSAQLLWGRPVRTLTLVNVGIDPSRQRVPKQLCRDGKLPARRRSRPRATIWGFCTSPRWRVSRAPSRFATSWAASRSFSSPMPPSLGEWCSSPCSWRWSRQPSCGACCSRRAAGGSGRPVRRRGAPRGVDPPGSENAIRPWNQPTTFPSFR